MYSIQSLPIELLGIIASYTDAKTQTNLAGACKYTKEAMDIFANEELRVLASYPENGWGAKRLRYLLNETENFTSSRRINLIFDEVKRCGQETFCKRFVDIPEAIERTAKNQAKFLKFIFLEMSTWVPVKTFLQDDPDFRGIKTNVDATNRNHINKISDWMERNVALLDGRNQVKIKLNPNDHLDVPHELRFFRKLRALHIPNRDFSDTYVNCMPIEIRKYSQFHVNDSAIYGQYPETVPPALKDWNYPTCLYRYRMDIAQLTRGLFEPQYSIKDFFNHAFRTIGEYVTLIVAKIFRSLFPYEMSPFWQTLLPELFGSIGELVYILTLFPVTLILRSLLILVKRIEIELYKPYRPKLPF